MKKTKITCIMGPNTDNRELATALATNSMGIARLNFSHGDYEEQRNRLDLLESVGERVRLSVTALLDIKGPEIRTRLLRNDKKVILETGQTYTLTTREIIGDNTIDHINYSGLNEDVSAGNRVLIDDGLIGLRVEKIDDTDTVCTVVNGGELGAREGVNMPNVKIKLPALTDKDKAGTQFGIKEGFGSIVVSLVRTADAVPEVKQMFHDAGANMSVIARTEGAKGIESIDAIIGAGDGIMVTRGDMGVEIPTEQVPYIQKVIIHKCNEACKPVITATQMLDFMIRSPRSIRAEMTDVANVVYDGTDVIMLSGEAAIGKYPVDTLKMIVRTMGEMESHLDYSAHREREVSAADVHNISNAVCHSSVSATHDLGARVVVTSSISGFMARMLSKWRPAANIIGLSPNIASVRQMQIYWGMTSLHAKHAESTDLLTGSSLELLEEKGVVKERDLAVVMAGVVTHAKRHEPAAHTNIMRVIAI